jgi:hypothetical protein
MATFQQPEVVSRDEVVKLGGLLPLTDDEINEISGIVGIDSSRITRLPIYRILSPGAWTPTLKDFLSESMKTMPHAHTEAVMEGYLTLNHVAEYATGTFMMADPATGEMAQHTILYPYPDLKWAHTTCS